jgi:AraC family transcriptional regulator, alkane utilization regulator
MLGQLEPIMRALVATMELLSDFDAPDPVSEVLRTVRVRSTVYCRSVLGAPWGFGVTGHGNPAFHVVTAGTCWLEVDGEPDQLPLAAGDLVVLPTGRRHWLRDDPATRATELEELLASTPLDEHRRLRHGGGGPPTGLLCGGFALEGAAHPVLRVLPTRVLIRGVDGHPVPWLAATLTLLSAETASAAPGAEEVVGRLADALLAQALRVALAELQSSDGAGVLALRDPQVAAAIELIHHRPDHPWTVGELAAEVALSRSAFSARFRRVVGESPKRYLTRTRLAHASTLLHQTDAPLAEIALQIGYASEFSFAKAFKRTFGIAPGTYHGQRHGVPGLGRDLDAAILTQDATGSLSVRLGHPS